MFCSECGTRSSGGRFCGACGNPMPTAAPGEPAPSPAPPVGGPTPWSATSTSVTTTGPGWASASAYPPPVPGIAVASPGVPDQSGVPHARVLAHPWDYARDLGAAAVLIWSLTLPWMSSSKASGVVYVLLTTLCAVLALTVLPLSKFLRKPDGSPLVWPTLAIRWLLCAPYGVVVMVAVVRDLAGVATGLGPALLVGVFGLAVAIVPRESEIRLATNGPVLIRGFRLACGWCGALGMAAIVASTLVAVPPDDWFNSGRYFSLVIIPILVVIGLFVAVYGVTALRVAAGHASWQPTLVWLGVGLLVAVAASSSGGAVESSRAPFYGLWLLVAATGLAAAPLLGGKDGDTSQATFWALVVANAFRVVVICTTIILILSILILIQISQYDGTIPGELYWALVSTVVTIAAAAVGSNRLRADPVSGRHVALTSVAIMVLLRIVDLIVLGPDYFGSEGAPVSLLLLAGTFGVIVFGLTVPPAMRPERQSLPTTSASSAPMTAGWPATTGNDVRGPQPLASPSTDLEKTYLIDKTGWVGATGTAPAVPSPPADPTALVAADPATPLAELMTIAGARPDLRPIVAANPSTYPDLLRWLAALNDPAVNDALSRRRGPS